MKLLFGLLLVGVAQAQTNNTAYGDGALSHNQGSANSAFGSALPNNQNGSTNTAVGFLAMQRNIDGSGNTAVGYASLQALGGDYNIGIGYMAGAMVGFNNNTGNDNNIEIGSFGLVRDTGVIRIGTQGVQRFTQIAGIRGVIVKGGQAVVVSSTGQLGVASTKVVPNVSHEEALSLRAEIAGLRTQVRELQAQMKRYTQSAK
jgi:hypothetical protein